MGRVYLATRRSGGEEKPVVIKVLRREVAKDKELRSMFLHEAKLGHAIAHEGIARMYDFGEADGRLYLAMEYVDGLPLSALTRAGEVPLALALSIIADIAAALGYAHDAKDALGDALHIVHRDVSPQNILIARDGRVKLIDFGVARSAGQGHKTESGVLKGKLSYMAPEQFRGSVDHRADIFALGVVLHELVSGRRLFKRGTQAEILTAVLLDPIPPIEAEGEVLEVLGPIVARALERRADDRFQDARDLESALRDAMATLGLEAGRQQLADLVAAGAQTLAERGDEQSARSWITHTDSDDGELYEERSGVSTRSDPPRGEDGADSLLFGAIPTPRSEAETARVGPEADDREEERTASETLAQADAAAEPSLEAVVVEAAGERRAPRTALVAVALVGLVGLGLGGALWAASGEEPTEPVTAQPAVEPVPRDAPEPAATPADEPEPRADSTPADGTEAAGEETAPTSEGEAEGEAGEETAPEEEAPARPPGRLWLRTEPWSRVRLGRRDLGTTPIVNAPVPAGDHVLRARDPDGHLHRIRVRIRSGRPTKRVVTLPRR